MADTWLQIITDALWEIGGASLGEAIDPDSLALGQRWLNRTLDSWQAHKQYAYAESFTQYTLVPGLQPHTIGAGAQITNTVLAGNLATYTAANQFNAGDFVTVGGCTNGAGVFNVVNSMVTAASISQFTVAIITGNVSSAAEVKGIAVPAASPLPTWLPAQSFQRPSRIEGAALILTDQTPNVDSPILTIRDADWWNNQRVKSLATNVPTDLYPQYAWPLVSLFFWPVPAFAYGVRLQNRTSVQQVSDLTQNCVGPEGFNSAVVLTLAENLCGPMRKAIPAGLPERAVKARALFTGNNNKSKRTSSRDYGVGGGRRRGFNYYTGN